MHDTFTVYTVCVLYFDIIVGIHITTIAQKHL